MNGDLESAYELLQRRDVEADDIDSLLLKFMETTTPLMQRLAESIARHEEKPACFAAHSLKGTFATIGLRDLADAIASVEEDCMASRWPQAGNNMAPVTSLFEEAGRLIAAAIHPPFSIV